MRALLTTGLDIAGIAAVTAGAALIAVPAGLIVGGVMVLLLSWRLTAGDD